MVLATAVSHVYRIKHLAACDVADLETQVIGRGREGKGFFAVNRHRPERVQEGADALRDVKRVGVNLYQVIVLLVAQVDMGARDAGNRIMLMLAAARGNDAD